MGHFRLSKKIGLQFQNKFWTLKKIRKLKNIVLYLCLNFLPKSLIILFFKKMDALREHFNWMQPLFFHRQSTGCILRKEHVSFFLNKNSIFGLSLSDRLVYDYVYLVKFIYSNCPKSNPITNMWQIYPITDIIFFMKVLLKVVFLHSFIEK